jgi:hypothetical protein
MKKVKSCYKNDPMSEKVNKEKFFVENAWDKSIKLIKPIRFIFKADTELVK